MQSTHFQAAPKVSEIKRLDASMERLRPIIDTFEGLNERLGSFTDTLVGTEPQAVGETASTPTSHISRLDALERQVERLHTAMLNYQEHMGRLERV